MNHALKLFLLSVVMAGVALAENLLGRGKGEEKKALVDKYAEETLAIMGPVAGIEADYGQVAKDFVSWATDNAVKAANQSGAFVTAGNETKAAAGKKKSA